MSQRPEWLQDRSGRPPSSLALSTHTAYRPLFDACDRLERAVVDSFPHGRAFPAHSTVPVVMAASMRCLKTVDAVLLLADGGYGPQSAALCRTMIEDVVTACWCSGQDGKEVGKRLAAHELSVALNVQAEGLAQGTYLKVLANTAILPEDSLRDFVAEYEIDRRLAKKHWTGSNVRQMASQAASSMRTRDIDTMEELLGLPYLLANLATHSSTASMNATLTSSLMSTRRPSELLVWDALGITHRVLSLLIPLMGVEGEALTKLDAVVDEDRLLFAVLLDHADAGRNDPCPCGSGRKYKRCHGDPK